MVSNMIKEINDSKKKDDISNEEMTVNSKFSNEDQVEGEQEFENEEIYPDFLDSEYEENNKYTEEESEPESEPEKNESREDDVEEEEYSLIGDD
mmetsp:Transcript_684/g.790  ORF Transcript_684/g.790 Transcript_684/m.790 type:complete len:94 (+) Transcript_684:980-1261(+)